MHARASAKKYGGKPEDYFEIHQFIDSSKAHFPDMRHRALLHSSFGIYIAERIFGTNLTNSDGKLVSVRDVAEEHVIQDMGRIPTVQDYLEGMPMYEWLGGPLKRTRTITLEPPAEEPKPETPGPGPADWEAVTRETKQIAEAIKNRGFTVRSPCPGCEYGGVQHYPYCKRYLGTQTID